MILRPYQQAAVDAVYNHLRFQENNPCVVLPTGTGKSVVIAQIVCDAVAQWNGRVLILAHVKELLEQKEDFGVAEIAEKVGYDDAYHFSKLFKKTYGMSPLKYRNRKG